MLDVDKSASCSSFSKCTQKSFESCEAELLAAMNDMTRQTSLSQKARKEKRSSKSYTKKGKYMMHLEIVQTPNKCLAEPEMELTPSGPMLCASLKASLEEVIEPGSEPIPEGLKHLQVPAKRMTVVKEKK